MAASPSTVPSNRLLALSLSDILDERKSASSSAEIAKIAGTYGMDAQTLERVARFVNTPSVAPQNVTRTVGKDGEERTTMLVSLDLCGASLLLIISMVHSQASWSEPLLDNEHKRVGG